MAEGGGFFGGLSGGLDAARADAATREQLRIMNERQKFAEGRQASSDASTNVTNTLEFIKEYATNLRAAGNDETKIAAALKPFIESVRTVAPKAGLDPDVVAHRALMVATVPQQSQDGESHQIVKVAGGLNQPDRILRIAKKGGSVVPIDPTTGQPVLGESDTITPRQAQVANAPMMPQAAPVQTTQLNTFNDRFNAAQGGVPVAPQAPMTAPGPEVIPPAPASGRNEQYLQKIPNQELRGLIKGIADYDIDVKSLSARAGERRQALMMVKEYDPNFNMADYNSIVGVKKAFTSGVERSTTSSQSSSGPERRRSTPCGSGCLRTSKTPACGSSRRRRKRWRPNLTAPSEEARPLWRPSRAGATTSTRPCPRKKWLPLTPALDRCSGRA
jgi:hypothetical protein